MGNSTLRKKCFLALSGVVYMEREGSGIGLFPFCAEESLRLSLLDPDFSPINCPTNKDTAF